MPEKRPIPALNFARSLLACAAAGSALAACCTGDPDCAAPKPVASSAPPRPADCARPMQIDIPSGISVERVQMLDDGQRFKVYTSFEMSRSRLIAEAPLPDADTLERELVDVMSRSRRFQVFTLRAGAAAEHSDVVVTARILDIQQRLLNIEGGRRVSHSSVRLSVQVKNMYTGENLLTSDAQVEGHTGTTNNDRVLVPAGVSTHDPDMQVALAQDLRTAAFRAFEEADERIETLLRPMAGVTGAVHGCSVDLFGGNANGLQTGDQVVVFRAEKRMIGQTPILANMQAVALLECRSVGETVSQCTLSGSTSGFKPQQGDYAIVTDASMRKARTR